MIHGYDYHPKRDKFYAIVETRDSNTGKWTKSVGVLDPSTMK